jgi:hypothetical protein
MTETDMADRIVGKRVAILAADGVEDPEVVHPHRPAKRGRHRGRPGGGGRQGLSSRRAGRTDVPAVSAKLVDEIGEGRQRRGAE